MQPLILMLESDEDDQHITRVTFDEHRYNARLEFAGNSTVLFDFLATARTSGEELPSLILASYRSFPMSVQDILTKIKSDGLLKHIPVVVLGTALPLEIIRECYACGAASVILKPFTSEGVKQKINSFFRYWFETATIAP